LKFAPLSFLILVAVTTPLFFMKPLEAQEATSSVKCDSGSCARPWQLGGFMQAVFRLSMKFMPVRYILEWIWSCSALDWKPASRPKDMTASGQFATWRSYAGSDSLLVGKISSSDTNVAI